MSAFRVPLPSAVPASRRLHEVKVDSVDGDFKKSDFSNFVLIGKGAFGKILKCSRDNKTFVMKEFGDDLTDHEKKLIRKEADLLKNITGHANVVEMFGFSVADNAILLQYVTFLFAMLNMEHENVSSLLDFLKACDKLCQFNGFEHCQYHIACDIARGLAYLHEHDIVHRDLKPDNVLLSNQHYTADMLNTWWAIKPVTAKLTDFGESRALRMQTNTLMHTRTANLYRGTPAYMSPEQICNNVQSATLVELKQMDVWAFGMTVFILINPNLRHPFHNDTQQAGIGCNAVDILKERYRSFSKPAHDSKYKAKQSECWRTLATLYDNFCKFDAGSRPSAKQCLTQLILGHVSIKPLLVSQNSKSEAIANEFANDWSPADQDDSDASDLSETTENACTFFAILISQRILGSEHDVDVGEIAQDVILNFPVIINAVRNSKHMYSVDEAYNVLDVCGLRCSKTGVLAIPCTAACTFQQAYEDLCKQLFQLLEANLNRVFSCIYICQPYSLIICKTGSGALSVIDTHPLPEMHGGNNTAAVITVKDGFVSVAALCNWLLLRVNWNGKMCHELNVIELIPVSHVVSPADVNDRCSVAESTDANDAGNHGNTMSPSLSDQAQLSDDSENEGEKDAADLILNTFSVSCASSSPVLKRFRRFVNSELSVDKWNDCETECVTYLPFDINGHKKYQIVTSRESMMTATKDGRPWKTWITSSRNGLNGVRRVARCAGCNVCSNDNCSFQKKYGSANKVQFQTVNGQSVCFTCGSVPDRLSCPAVKIWEYEKNENYVTVFHDGMHTCCVKKKKINRRSIRDEIVRNPGVKPSKLVNDRMVQMMSTDEVCWQEIDSFAEQFVDLKQVHNLRASLASESQPDGHNFEALGKFKVKCDEKDKFLIYRINNRELNCQPSLVFKSSEDMAKIAIEMDMDSNGLLNGEYAYIDAKHDRCRGYKTLTLWVQHPVYRKLLTLAVMDVEAEDTANLTRFWQILNEMLQEVTKRKEYVFNPKGFVADENAANWRSIAAVYGEEKVKSVVSCEFHYKQSVHRHARQLRESSQEFVVLANDLLEAVTVSDFEKARQNMSNFVSRHDHLAGWLKWWTDRRSHIFRAFKASDAPSSNLAEVGHAKMQAVGRRNMSLLEAAREDVASAIRQSAEMRLFVTGAAKGGRGKNDRQRKASKHAKAMKQVQAFCNEIDEMTNDVHESASVFIPKSGKHRPPNSRKSPSCASPAANAETIRPLHLAFFSGVTNLKVCYGCKKQFADKYKKKPHNLVLKHFCRRSYKDKEGVTKQSKTLQAAYFHLNMDCVRKVLPHAEVRDVIVHEEIKRRLTEGHTKLIQQFGIRM